MTNNRPAIPPFRHGNTTLRMHGKFVTLVDVFRTNGSNDFLMDLVDQLPMGSAVGSLDASFSLPQADAYLNLI